MFYKAAPQKELSRTQMDRARKVFGGMLWKLRFNPEFIHSNRDELLSIAHTEYVRALDKGVEIEDPVGWTVHCAWRRTQNLLTALKCQPQMVSSEKVAELIDVTTPTPAQIAEDTDRARKIRKAVAQLEERQRALIALTYFEELTVSDAARRLEITDSSARRCHRSALKRLHELLGVESSDELEFEIGLIAWLSVAGTGSAFQFPAGLEAALDKAGHEATNLWARAHDLARRLNLSGGGDAAGAVTTSGAGRAVGVCATTVAVACFAGASGVVGPGIDGGFGVLNDRDQPQREKVRREAPATSIPVADPEEASSSVPVVADESAQDPSASASPAERAARRAQAAASTRKREREQVREQTDAFARAASESTSPSPAPSASASGGSTEPAPAPAPSTAPAGGGSSSGAAQAAQQFGAFK